MGLRAAVLDLGTNTFHLLIAESDNGSVTFLHRDERWVYLAEDGIERIGDNALQRMDDVLTEYRNVMDRYEPTTIQAFGTAAFRRAENGNEAIALVDKLIGVVPRVLTGDEEAAMIYNGVRWAAAHIDDVVVVMDIGGGSTEFIIGQRDDILWKKSYPIGATVLRQRFHKIEPIVQSERASLKQFVMETTADLQQAVKQFKPRILIGSSGSFDSFASMLFYQSRSDSVLTELNINDVNALVDELCGMNEQERKQKQGLIWFRVGPIVTAGLLTQTVIELVRPEKVFRSAYALKEGALRRLLYSR